MKLKVGCIRLVWLALSRARCKMNINFESLEKSCIIDECRNRTSRTGWSVQINAISASPNTILHRNAEMNLHYLQKLQQNVHKAPQTFESQGAQLMLFSVILLGWNGHVRVKPRAGTALTPLGDQSLALVLVLDSFPSLVATKSSLLCFVCVHSNVCKCRTNE